MLHNRQQVALILLLRFILITGLQVLASCFIPPRPEFALEEEVNLYLGQLPVTETNACHSTGLNECSDFDGTKDLDSYHLSLSLLFPIMLYST